MDDHEDSSSHTDSSLSSDTEGEQQNDEDASTAGEQGVKAKSKQLSYYYRTTEDRPEETKIHTICESRKAQQAA